MVGTVVHFLQDLEGPKLLVVKFLCWSSCVDVPGVEPDLVSDLEVGLGHGLCVIVQGLSLQGYLDIELEVSMEVLELLDPLSSRLVGLGNSWDCD